MTVVLHHPGNSNSEIDPLNFELAGVMDIPASVARLGVSAVMQFQNDGHPNGTEFTPGMIVSVAPEITGRAGTYVPFGVFLATKESNPSSDRPLRSSFSLEDYRKRFPVLAYDSSWQSWDDVVRLFKPQFPFN